VRELRKLFPQQNKLGFLMVLGKVQEQLRVYLSLRGRSWNQLAPLKSEESADSSSPEETTASEGESICASDSVSCAGAEEDTDRHGSLTVSSLHLSHGHFVPVLLPEEEVMGGLSCSSSCASLSHDIIVLPQMLIDTE